MAATNNFKISNTSSISSLLVTSPPLSLNLPNDNVSSPFFGTTLPRIVHSSHQNSPIPTLSRRLFLPSVSGIWNALTGGGDNSPREAIIAIRRGMLLFRQGDVLGSVVEFDKAIELDPRQKAYLWQRGLSLYYLNRFEEGAEQFRLDVAQNPNDTEESIWCFLCEAQLYGVDEARRRFLELSGQEYVRQYVLKICFPIYHKIVEFDTVVPTFRMCRALMLQYKNIDMNVLIAYLLMQVGIDSRPVMREAYQLFKDGGDPEKLVAAFSSGRENQYFYASLYAGLYYESQNKSDEAKLHLTAACKSPYGSRSDDYMASLAKVHCDCRNWTFT
ncbi:hypothetical protein BUALT_Bualt19G0067100 [Buddleja alternifolia]|uniref:Uncharacterized protein n=1 Tax=Buddleja alternifolia TaxID=168488 RepID=A0AAV6W067_9LAMI|nr:hypothetical protein BUALT_Bualt19G0067100 [Buddleja alternifolia]